MTMPPPPRPPVITPERTVVAIIIAVLLGDLETQLGWPPGSLITSLLAIPLALVALWGQTWEVIFALTVTSIVLVTDSWLRAHGGTVSSVLFLPVVEAGALGILCLLVHRRIGRTEQNVAELTEMLERQRRELLEQTVTTPPPGSEAHEEKIEFAMLLLSMQEIGHRISGCVERPLLLDSVMDLAVGLVEAHDVRIFQYDAEHGHLSLMRAEIRSGLDPVPLSSSHPYVQWVLNNGRILTRAKAVRQAVAADGVLKRTTPRRRKEDRPPHAIAPLLVGGEPLGLIVIDEVKRTTQHQQRLLHILSHFAALGLKNAQLFEHVQRLARQDGLTQLHNRAAFQTELAESIETARQTQQPLSLIVGDIDRFKKFNDDHGHLAGDQVLRQTARLWKAVMPDRAFVARYGGEEFVTILPQTDLSEACDLAEILRETIEDFPFSYEGRLLSVTSSFGIAMLGRPAGNADDLFRYSDEALYQAKHSGRNLVYAADEMTDRPTRSHERSAPE